LDCIYSLAITPDEPDTSLSDSLRWDSHDNLTIDDDHCDADADPQMVVAVHNFTAGGPEQLTIHANDELRISEYSEQRDWCQATNRRGESGWVPSNYVKPINSIEKHSWFHGPISRNEAEYLLSSGINGSFLVRESESNPGQHSVSLRYEGRVFHYRIQSNSEGFKYISQEHYFKTLPELIHHHSQQPDGLITVLRYPVTKPNAPVFGMPQKSDRWEIKKNDIQMHDRLGGGQYGEVYKARWKSCNKIVAVKTFRVCVNDRRLIVFILIYV
jgi:abelson tyrosine-protein kinase 1